MSSSSVKSLEEEEDVDKELREQLEYQRRPPDPRDSFDRFGDDMADLIINRPPIDTVSDLIRWESLSRQVQRIGIGYENDNQIIRIELTDELVIRPLMDYDECRRHGIPCRTLDQKFCRHIMKRYPQIQCIDLKSVPMNPQMTDIMAIIVDNWRQLWPKLKRIDGLVLAENAEHFVNIIGPLRPMISTLDVSRAPNPKPWLRQFKHLRQLTIRHIIDIFSNVNQQLVEGLQGLCLRQIVFVDMFQGFVDQNPQLIRLVIDSPMDDHIAVGPLAENESLIQISRLQNLQQLTIRSHTLYEQSIGQPLAQIAGHCRQLRHFSIRFGYSNESLQLFAETIVAIKRMNQLKQLEVETIDVLGMDDNIIELFMTDQLTRDQRLAFQVTAKCWPRLRRLKFKGKMLALVANQEFFQEIHRTLPLLQSLYCRTNTINVSIDGHLVWQSLFQLRLLSRVVIRGPVLTNITRHQLIEQLWQRRSKLNSIFIQIVDQNHRLADIILNPLPED